MAAAAATVTIIKPVPEIARFAASVTSLARIKAEPNFFGRLR
jgi:hypothetical protein